MELWRKSMLKSYRQSLDAVRQAASLAMARVTGDPDADADDLRDLELLAGMAADLGWVMEYLRTGQPPARPDRENMPPLVHVAEIPATARPVRPAGMGEMTGRLAKRLQALTRREREVYVLVRGQGMGFAEAADVLDISRQTARKLFERAETKIRRRQAAPQKT